MLESIEVFFKKNERIVLRLSDDKEIAINNLKIKDKIKDGLSKKITKKQITDLSKTDIAKIKKDIKDDKLLNSASRKKQLDKIATPEFKKQNEAFVKDRLLQESLKSEAPKELTKLLNDIKKVADIILAEYQGV